MYCTDYLLQTQLLLYIAPHWNTNLSVPGSRKWNKNQTNKPFLASVLPECTSSNRNEILRITWLTIIQLLGAFIESNLHLRYKWAERGKSLGRWLSGQLFGDAGVWTHNLLRSRPTPYPLSYHHPLNLNASILDRLNHLLHLHWKTCTSLIFGKTIPQTAHLQLALHTEVENVYQASTKRRLLQ